jgi:hypothetical protein
MLRILFSRLGEPHIGPPGRSPSTSRRSGERRITSSAAARRDGEGDLHRHGGMCPRCEGRGSVTDFDLTALYDDGKSLNEGR